MPFWTVACLKRKHEVREVTNVSGVLMSQNAKSVRSALQTLISPFHTARSSKEFPVTGNYNPPGGPQRHSSTCILFSLCPQEHKADSCFLEKLETCKQPGCMISILFNFSFSFPPRNKPDLCLNRFVTQKLCFLHSIKNQEHKFSVPRCFSSI